jgi:chromosome segregation ATPase
MNQTLSSIDQLTLHSLEKRINLSESQANEYATEILETELQIEKLQAKINDLRFWLKSEENYTLELKSKFNNLKNNFSNK